jgi:acyl-CoA synthetase (AMP-forming)/AMP-acid ligase II
VTVIDGILAVAVLAGLALNAGLGWWWADPVAGYVLVYYAARKVWDCWAQRGFPCPTRRSGWSPLRPTDPVAAGTRGEIVVRGPNVTPGYWENPEATAAAFDNEGWFHSGDIGYLDEDGYLDIVDRLKDMIISGGENIYPAEVERALADMPGLTDVAVVGTPDEKWGETTSGSTPPPAATPSSSPAPCAGTGRNTA